MESLNIPSSENLCISLLFFCFSELLLILNFLNASDSFILPLAQSFPLNNLSLDYLFPLSFLGLSPEPSSAGYIPLHFPKAFKLNIFANAIIFSHQNSYDKWQCYDFKEISQ